MSNSNDNEQDEQPVPTIDLSSIEKWRHQFDGISDVRKQDLKNRFWAWTPNRAAEGQPGPFEGEHLTALEVKWLAEWEAYFRMDDLRNHQDPDSVPWDDFPLPLMGVDLVDSDLHGAHVPNAHLERARLGRANLKGANLSGARLNGANLRDAHLEEAKLDGADLTGARLTDAHLEGADLSGAHLRKADLYGAHLEGVDLSGANLENADLRGASLNKMTKLGGAILTGVLLDQAFIDGTNFTAVDWKLLPTLGDEMEAQNRVCEVPNWNNFDDDQLAAPGSTSAQKRTVEYAPKSRGTRVSDYAAATRAYRILANALQSQGIGEDADRYAFRAQVMRRKQLWYQRRWLKHLWMRFLSLSVGHGYYPWRIVATYAVVVLLFGLGFLLAGTLGSHAPLTWQAVEDAAHTSLNAIHGRVFFAQFHLDTLQSWLATLESVIGIVIEGIFVAALIQKLFSR